MSTQSLPAEKRRRASVGGAAALASLLVLLPAASASAAEHVWYYGDTASSVTRYEPASSQTKQRSGVNAEVFNISSTAQTTVWLGSYYTTGGYSANLTGPLGYSVTKAKWVWLISPNDPGKLPFRVAITRPGGGGMRAAESEPEIGKEAHLAAVDGTAFRVDYGDDRVTLFADSGDFSGSTWASLDDFEKHGITIRFAGPNGAVQAHLLPDGFASADELAALGLTSIGENLYLGSTDVKSGIVEIPSAEAARDGRGALQLAIYGDPGA